MIMATKLEITTTKSSQDHMSFIYVPGTLDPE